LSATNFYLSHIIKSSNGFAETLSGEFLYFCIQIISSTDSNKRAVTYIEANEKKFFNCKDDKDFSFVIKNILKKYKPFTPEILYIDKAYDLELCYCIIESFLRGETNIQEKIDEYNLKKGLE
jgi:hypothetical protein